MEDEEKASGWKQSQALTARYVGFLSIMLPSAGRPYSIALGVEAA